jgi:hypothetical protein
MAGETATNSKAKSSPAKVKVETRWGAVAALKSTDVVSVVLDVPTAKTLLHALSVAIGGGGNGKGKGKGKGGK